MKIISSVTFLVACLAWLGDCQPTQDQIELVQGIWTELPLPIDLERHGAVLYARLVTEYPDVGQLYPFGNEGLTYDQLVLDDRVKAKGSLTLMALAHALDIVQNPTALVSFLENLADEHPDYVASKDNYQYVLEALIYAIEEGIGHELDEDTEVAVRTFFNYVIDTMFANLPDNSAN